MEFGLEMIIRAAEENLDIREIPIELHPRGGVSKSRCSGTAGGRCT